MLAMERLPLSQPPYPGALPLSSPTIQSPRAAFPAPLIQGLPSPPSLHSSHHGPHPSHITIPKARPGSTSSLSSIHTSPPYDTTLIGSNVSVYSPTRMQPSPVHPQRSAEHEHQVCRTDGTPLLSPITRDLSDSVAQSNTIVSTPMASIASSSRESSSPTGE